MNPSEATEVLKETLEEMRGIVTDRSVSTRQRVAAAYIITHILRGHTGDSTGSGPEERPAVLVQVN